MDEQDRSEARAVYRNARQGSQGKGDKPRGTLDKAPIWCNCFPARFKDKCKVCNEH